MWPQQLAEPLETPVASPPARLAEVGVAVAFRLGERSWAGTWQGRSVAAWWDPRPLPAGTAATNTFSHPGVAAVLAVRSRPGVGTVVVSRLVAGRRWPELVAVSGSVDDAAADRLDGGLAAAHAAGFRCPNLCADNLIVGDDGRVWLTGLRPAGLVDTDGETAEEASMLAGILSTAPDMATRRPGERPRRPRAPSPGAAGRGSTGVRAPAHARSSGAVLDPAADRVGRAPGRHRAGPSRTARSDADRSPRRLGPRRGWGWGLVVAALAAGAASAMMLAAGGRPAPAGALRLPPRPAAGAQRAAADRATGWPAVLAQLSRSRSRAFVTGASLLAADAPGSPALSADRRWRAELAARGLHPSRLVVHVEGARVLRFVPPRAEVRVTDSLAGYALLDRAGRPVRLVVAGRPRRWTLTLVLEPAGWRIYRAEAAGGAFVPPT